MYKFLIYLCLILFIEGCSSFKEDICTPKLIETIKLKPVSLPEYFLSDCRYPKPPDKEHYLSLSLSQRERALTDIYLEGVKEVKACNIRLTEARAYQKKMIAIMEDPDNVNQKDPKTNTR